MNTASFIQKSADEMEGEIGGCAMDALREDDRFFSAPVDAYSITWFVSRERSGMFPNEPRYGLAVHGTRQFVLDLDECVLKEDDDGADADNLWRLV